MNNAMTVTVYFSHEAIKPIEWGGIDVHHVAAFNCEPARGFFAARLTDGSEVFFLRGVTGAVGNAQDASMEYYSNRYRFPIERRIEIEASSRQLNEATY